MSVRPAVRSLALLALTGPLAATLVVGAAPAALASASWAAPTPADGQVLTTNSFTVKVSVTSGSASVKLSLSGSARSGGSTTNVCTYSVSSSGGVASSAQTLTVAVPSSSTCTTSKNAQWTATLSGGATGTRTFYTNAAPDAPSGFTAQGSGARDVAFSWTKGSESDLAGYALYEGGTLIDSIDLSACSGSSCSYGLYYPSDKPGDHSYQLAAQRTSAGCSSCGSTVESASRASAGATLVEPPKPSPSPSATPSPTTDPSTGGTTGGSSTGGSTTGGSSTGGSSGGSTSGGSTGGSSTGGSSTGGSSTSGGSSSGGTTKGTTVQSGPKPTLPALDPIVAQRRAFALRFNAFSPSLGIPKLPPLPAITLPNLNPGEAPLPLGTYNPQLPYQPATETEKYTDGTLAKPVAAVRDALDSERLARSIAGALILLLIGAHLRRFLGTHVED